MMTKLNIGIIKTLTQGRLLLLIIMSRPEGRWIYIFFVILRDGKLEGGCT